MKYHYVQFVEDLYGNTEYITRLNYDIRDNKEIELVYLRKNGKLRSFLHKLHFAPGLRFNISLPLVKMWNKTYYTPPCNLEKPICFIFDRAYDKIFRQSKYYDYLRLKYPDCKLIFLFKDRIEGTLSPYGEKEREYLREKFDDILVYSIEDAEKFGFTFFCIYDSNLPVQSKKEYEGFDFFFCGVAKDRLSYLKTICRKANANGLKCYFYIFKANETEKEEIPGIVYADTPISFEEIKERSKSARCVVDVVQGKATALSGGIFTALHYNKMLITNNPFIQYTRFYDKKYIQIVKNANDVDFSMFFKKENAPDYSYKDELSPKNFYQFIDEHLISGTTPEIFYSSFLDIQGLKEYINSNCEIK